MSYGSYKYDILNGVKFLNEVHLCTKVQLNKTISRREEVLVQYQCRTSVVSSHSVLESPNTRTSGSSQI